MQPIKRGFQLIGASFSLALKHTALQEPWFTLGAGSLVILFFWFIPMAAVISFLELTPWGLALIGFLTVCVFSDLLVWGEMASLLTARAMNALEETPEDEKLSNIQFLKKHGMAVFNLSLAKPVLLIGNTIQQLFTSKVNDRNLWLKAHTLALPVIAIDKLPLKEAPVRLQKVVQENLLPIREKLVRVRLIAGLIQILLTAVGIVLAFCLGVILSDSRPALWQHVLAVGIAMLAGWLPIFIGILFSSYTRTCYATALYQWVQNVETARNTGEAEAAQPPQILRRVLRSGRA